MAHWDSNTSSSSSERFSSDSSPVMMSPWNFNTPSAVVGSEGHIYSLAAKDGLLYTGSDSKNIRAWRNMHELNPFKSSSAFVKAIVISRDRIFTGHQDGRIRVWKMDSHRQIGTLPTFFSLLKASMSPNNYVQVKRNRRALWIKHADAVSCLSISEEDGLLYSASWDTTFKVWDLHNSRCIQSVGAHDDAVNAVAAAAAGLVYTGSADGTVKVWRRERDGKVVRHLLWRTLLRQDSAVTALAVGEEGSVVYCGSSDGLVNFWEVEKHGGVLRGHQLAVLCLAAAGNLVLSGSADKTICVWRREGVEHKHTCLTVLSGHAGPVKCLAVEAEEEDGKWKVYSGSLDNSVKRGGGRISVGLCDYDGSGGDEAAATERKNSSTIMMTTFPSPSPTSCLRILNRQLLLFSLDHGIRATITFFRLFSSLSSMAPPTKQQHHLLPYEDTSSSYYLQHSENPDVQLVTQQLTGSNYSNWHRSMTTALMAKNNLAFVNGSIERPHPTDLLYSQLMHCNSMVVSWLRNSVVIPEISSSIMYIDDAFLIWNDLKYWFSQEI